MAYEHNEPGLVDPQVATHTHLFTLRLWKEQLGDGVGEWRGRLQDIDSGETHYFRDWPGLVKLLSGWVEGSHDTGSANVQGVPPETF